MRVIKMLTLACGPDGNKEIGKLYPVTAAEAETLKAAGAAEDPTPAELRKYGAATGAQPADDSDFDAKAGDDSDPETATNKAAETAETAAKRAKKAAAAAKKAAAAAKKAKAGAKKDKAGAKKPKSGNKSPAAAAAGLLNDGGGESTPPADPPNSES